MGVSNWLLGTVCRCVSASSRATRWAGAWPLYLPLLASGAGTLEKAVSKILPVVFVELARIGVMRFAAGCGQPYDLSHQTACAHDTDTTERLVGHTDIPTGHEQVFYVPRVEASIRNVEGLWIVCEMGLRDEGIAFESCLVLFLG